ncbi:MAG: D-alanyl-D-alanine carboxypeptidase/D-alanyl-D-alanine-endopeptidase [Candidatus Eremiobacteraeota bacterium]|nr:D-alanyl-D-alanine carboxypeptidase/D-alanyl-D-alanine-endopeptidase [Candidatus Eremiobacteraeota bacterium]
MRNDIQAQLAKATRGAGAWSCVVLAEDGRQLYDDRGDAAVTPASVQKLIIAASAMHTLGSTYRFPTLLASESAPQSGVLAGDLWLVGSGDPSLVSNDLRGGVKQLAQQGIRSITGSVAVDARSLSGPEYNPLWNADDANEDYAAAISGISLDQDTVEFHIDGAAAGEPAQIHLEPPNGAVSYTGSVRTVASTSYSTVIVAAAEAPNLFLVSGQIPAGDREVFYIPIRQVPRYVGSVLQRMLRDRGIASDRSPRIGRAPIQTQLLWEHRSRPLHDLVRKMLFESNNHFADQLLRVVGARASGLGGDRSGLRAEREYLQTLGVPAPGLHIVDGSGLSDDNRIASITLARLLFKLNQLADGNPIYRLLPRGGQDGTIRNYRFGAALGRVRAKSGHITGVESLAGYVNTRRHGRLIFAFIINGSPGDPDNALVSAVDRLAEF